MRRALALAVLAPMILVMSSLSASADTITVTSLGPGDNLSISTSPTSPSVTGQGVFAGQLNAIFDHNTPSAAPFAAYCVDLYHDFNAPPPEPTWNLTSATTAFNPDPSNPAFGSVSNGNNQAELTRTQNALAYLYNTYSGLNVGSFPTDVQASALQLAIWSVEYNGVDNALLAASNGGAHFDFTAPGNSTGDNIVAQFITDVTALQVADAAHMTGLETATFFMADHSESSNAQDFIGGSGTGFMPAVVPEPGSLFLMTVGLGAVAFGVRKTRQARQNV